MMSPETHAAPDLVDDVAERLADVRDRIRAAATAAGRSPSSVLLVAVSKGHPPEAVAAALAAGQRDLGESTAQELVAKAAAIGAGIRWHFVGRLQRNKVKDVIGRAGLIHSVDRMPLAEAIAERSHAAGRVQRVLVQVNVGDDPDKAGCSTDEVGRFVGRVRELTGIAVQGLMAIPPLDGDPSDHFATLRGLRDDLRGRFPEVQHLSMGMSGDVESAIAEGATIVRVGESVFGPRPSGTAPESSKRKRA